MALVCESSARSAANPNITPRALDVNIYREPVWDVVDIWTRILGFREVETG